MGFFGLDSNVIPIRVKWLLKVSVSERNTTEEFINDWVSFASETLHDQIWHSEISL